MAGPGDPPSKVALLMALITTRATDKDRECVTGGRMQDVKGDTKTAGRGLVGVTGPVTSRPER